MAANSRLSQRLNAVNDAKKNASREYGYPPHDDGYAEDAYENGSYQENRYPEDDYPSRKTGKEEMPWETDTGFAERNKKKKSPSTPQPVKQKKTPPARRASLPNDGGMVPDDPEPAGMSMEQELEDNEADEMMRSEDKERRWAKFIRVVNICLVAGCIYIVFLIYGVFVTEYQYDDSGAINPQVLSVSDIKEKKNYEVIMVMYENCRILYEETLILDYRVGEGVENTMAIAPEYEELLDEVTNLSVKAEALSVESQYSQVQSMIVSWIQDDIAVYLQNMSDALSQEDTEILSNALQDQQRVYSNFSLITENMVALGENVPGIDLTDIKEWTPEGYVDETINGSTDE